MAKEGKDTTEHAVAKSNSTIGIIMSIIGVLTTIGSVVATQLGTDSKVGIIAGAVIAGIGLISKTLTDLGYIKSRTDVKASAPAPSVKDSE